MYAPTTLKEYIGQEQMKAQLELTIAAARMRGTTLPHILFSGKGGTGKTTIAKILATEMKHRLRIVTPMAFKNTNDVFKVFNEHALKFGNGVPLVLFVDEVHRFDIQVEESFYLPMENNIVIRTAGSNRDAYDVPPWTLLGATTVPGRLTEPFTSRFGLHFVMQPYTFEEMCTIVSQAAEKTGYEVSRGAIEAVVLRSREIPRIANHLLDRCADYAIVAGSTHIDEDVAQRVFALMGVDDKGLSDNDRKYLSTLYEADRPLGVASLEPALHMDKLSIAKSIEPYLVEKGYILLTGRGRTLTDKGIEYVEGFTGVKHGLKLAGGEN